MRILLPNYEYPPLGGGAAPVSRELAASLASRGHEVDVVTMRYGDLPRTETDGGVTVYRVASLRASQSMARPHEMATYLPAGFAKARQLFLERDHEVVLAHFILPTGVIAYLLDVAYGVPYYVTAHGSDVPGYNPDRFTALHRLTRPAWKHIVARAEAIVSPSKHLAGMIRSASEEATIEVIPNGFDADRYDPDRRKDERILATSRLFERKGVQYLLGALASIDTDWDVVVSGEGPYRETLERTADRLGVDTTFTGWVDRERLEDLLETSAIYVFPSSHENCPVALQEAMAAGCAIVASKHGGTGEVLGDAGIAVDPRDGRALSAALDHLIVREELRRELGRRARNRITSEYGWERITSKYEALVGGTATTQPGAMDNRTKGAKSVGTTGGYHGGATPGKSTRQSGGTRDA